MIEEKNKKRRIVVVGKGGGGIEQVQSDWSQQDSTQVDFIKNKPTLYSEWFGTQEEYDDIETKEAGTIYYIEDENGTVIRNNKKYGIKVLIEQPEIEDITITENGVYTHAGSYGYDKVTVSVPEPVLTTLEATENGTYTPSEGVDGYDEVVVNVTEHVLTTLEATENGTYTPAEGVDGYDEVVVNVQSFTYPDYLTCYYMPTQAADAFSITGGVVPNTKWRFKGEESWREQQSQTIAVDGYGMVVIEFMLNDPTKVPGHMFYNVGKLVKVELPETVTKIEGSAFNGSGLMELPNFTNVTNIGGDSFFSCIFNYADYTINDEVDRSGWDLKSFNFSDTSNFGEKMYINGMVYKISKRFTSGGELDFSGGIGGLPIYKWRVYGPTYKYNLSSMKFPSTMTHITGRAFQSCTVTNLYFYSTTPPICETFDGQGIWYSSNITNIYVPASALTDYQNSSDFADVVSKIQAMEE